MINKYGLEFAISEVFHVGGGKSVRGRTSGNKGMAANVSQSQTYRTLLIRRTFVTTLRPESVRLSSELITMCVPEQVKGCTGDALLKYVARLGSLPSLS